MSPMNRTVTTLVSVTSSSRQTHDSQACNAVQDWPGEILRAYLVYQLLEYPAMKYLIFLLALALSSINAVAGGVYQEPDAFIAEVFADKPPKAEVIWPDQALKAQIREILGHDYQGLRIRYWHQGQRTAWILDEIGKDKPITTGFVINQGRMERVRVLIFRESRGWEIRHAFFTDQFDNASLKTNSELDRTIDNISGATLSVRAVTKLARVALLLDQTVRSQKGSE